MPLLTQGESITIPLPFENGAQDGRSEDSLLRNLGMPSSFPMVGDISNEIPTVAHIRI